MIDFDKIAKALDGKFPPTTTDEISNPQTFSLSENETKIFFYMQTRTKKMIIEALREYHDELNKE